MEINLLKLTFLHMWKFRSKNHLTYEDIIEKGKIIKQ